MFDIKTLALLKHGKVWGAKNIVESALLNKWSGGASYEKTVGPASIISISDAKPKPAKSLIVSMEPIQSGSGDPSPDNIRPISGRTGENITHTGVNLFEPTAWNNYKVHGVSFNGSDCTPLVTFLNTLPAGDYTISFKFDVETTVSGSTSWGILLHSTSGYIDGRTSGQHNAGETLTFTRSVTITDANKGTFDHAYLYSGGGNKADIYMYAFQLQVGSTATAYEAYNGTTIPISWNTEAGTVYGGTVDVVSGVLTVDRAMVDLGTLTWTKIKTSGDHWRFWAMLNTMRLLGQIISSQYRQISAAEQYMGAQGIANQASASYVLAMVSDERYADAVAFKTAMSGVQLVYELANPITHQLTPQQIQMLKGSNTLWSDADDLTLTYIGTTPPNLLGGMLGNTQEPTEETSEEPEAPPDEQETEETEEP